MVEIANAAAPLDLTATWMGVTALVVFVLAYAVVVGEEFLHIRKSMPVLVAAGIIWALIGWRYAMAASAASDPQTARALAHVAEEMVRHNLLEYAELFLFLLVAMTFINSMEERGVFDALRGWMVSRGFSLRSLYWMTGGLAFCISPIADNMTTALLMGTVVMSVGVGHPRFVIVSLISIVVAANAGGAFSPFGDITTLMVWQKGLVSFSGFFALFLPSLVNWLVPAAIMSVAVGVGRPAPITEQMRLQPGAFVIVALFLLTIVATVCVHQFLHLPPVIGMMTGLGVLKVYGWTLQRAAMRAAARLAALRGTAARLELHSVDSDNPFEVVSHAGAEREPFDVFKHLERAEWDTLMFFYGVILCVGGLGTIGYLELLSHVAYGDYGATTANITIGVLSALIDNIPVMFAVLSMQPAMDVGQWLLVTLTAGVGGSLLSIGSAAGVALMGQARGTYTFMAHLKWSWAIALGYVASIWVHFLVNGALFTGVAVR